jgi:anthraniloyl-CoA monooxygenase
MPGRRIAIVGGGPAGLTAARILRLRQPSWQVTVLERQPPEATFGYGVGLSFTALDRLAAADAELAGAIRAAAVSVAIWTMRRDGVSLSARNSHGLAIGRAALLRVLRRHAAAAGAVVRTGRPVRLAEVAGADVIVAADGAGSLVRAELAARLGATVRHGELAYLWCGAELALTEMTLALARTAAGPLAAHVMPYAPAACTFQVDAHQKALASWGLPPTGGEDSIGLLRREFADLLAGARLVAKRTDWVTFPTVSCERWHWGNVVLLGDAAHTAHYTVGSGTALAVEDAAELATALAGTASPAAAFEAFQAARQDRVVRLQRRADRSQRWWTTLATRIDWPLPRLLLSYLTRTGAITLTAVARQNAALLARCFSLGSHPVPAGAGLAGFILAQPAAVNGTCLPGRVYRPADLASGAVATVVHDSGRPTLAGMRDLAGQVRDLAGQGVSVIRVAGPPGREDLLDRLELAEFVRGQAGVSTIVVGPAELRDDLALGIVTGRTDLADLALPC